MSGKVESLERGRKRACPICGKAPVDRFTPFCSKRCADIDLSRWLKGSYAIPVVEEDASATPEDGDADDRR